jgi:stearoyl-CoA desaturase (delta-9 desaturase)
LDLITPASTWALAESSPSTSAANREARVVSPAVDPCDVDLAVDDHGHSHANGGMPRKQQITMFFSVVGPIAGLAAAVAMLWYGGRIGWPEFWAMLVMYSLTGFGVTIGFHRLMTHRSFDTFRPIRYFLAIWGSVAGQGMAIRWCATHRRHHQRADREGDPHSPHLHGDGPGGLLRGMYHAHVAWCFDKDADNLGRSVPDLLADRWLLLIDKLYFFWVGLGLLVPAVALGLYYGTWGGFFSGLVWGGLLRICLLQHVTWCINSVCHVWGGRTFKSGDHSTNNLPFAILALGEGWHNNHHAFPTSARHGLQWWQFDSSYLIIRTMKALGLAWDVRLPSQAALDAKRIVPA